MIKCFVWLTKAFNGYTISCVRFNRYTFNFPFQSRLETSRKH